MLADLESCARDGVDWRDAVQWRKERAFLSSHRGEKLRALRVKVEKKRAE